MAENTGIVRLTMTGAELSVARQWFDTAQDLSHRDYLGKEDYELAEKVYTQLGMRVPSSIAEKI